jgi:uncharacterized membrane protein YccC
MNHLTGGPGGGIWSGIVGWSTRHRAQLRQCIRATVVVLASFAVGQALNVPLVLWVVLTAVIVIQVSVGGSLKATFEYLAGTLGGGVYGGAIATLVPHSGEMALLGVLAIAVAPLALLAAINPSFRVAPITALIVLLGPSSAQGGPIASAVDRMLEVGLGGITALAVALLVLPARAHVLSIEAAARMLERIAEALPPLFAGFSQSLGPAAIRDLQTGIGQALAKLDAVGAEAQRERQALGLSSPDLGPLIRTLLRLRHDVVMLGRAAMVPLPETLRPRLVPALAQIAAAAADDLRGSAAALTARRQPPAATVEAALDGYAAAIAAIRREGLMREMPGETVERIFALGFALDQLRHNFHDLARCVAECAQSPSAPATSDTAPQQGHPA